MSALLKSGISVLLMASAASVFAAPRHDGGGYGAAGEARHGSQIADRGDFQSERRAAPEDSRRFNRSAWQDENKAPETQAENPSEPSRRAGRMSPEERRALRRQINEAGHDIYLSKP